jgi:peptide subunit release factor 1 (eRF1)
MKLTITIPEDKYRYIQELEQDNTDYATTRMLYHAVKHGKPYLEQPKTGHWIELGYLEDDNYDFECSVCHHTDTHSKTVKVNYCWNCGAKMECEVEE